MQGAQHRMLSDGRLHLHHGPIDMILRADGPGAEAGYGAAVKRFETLLGELVAELALLRRPALPGACPFQGAVAGRMAEAARAHWPAFVTPMAAVAGAGAEAVLQAMTTVPGISRAHVNNGGDIALFLSSGAAPFRLAVVVDPENPASPGVIEIGADSPWRGVATSGAKGRSHSMGIADSVSVIAATAPAADVAATLIANATDLPGDPRIGRAPAHSLSPDSDLGARLVTTHVPPLPQASIDAALSNGEGAAAAMVARGLIGGALIVLQGTARVVGHFPLVPANPITTNEKALIHV